MSPAARSSLPRPRWRSILAVLADETGATAVEYGLIAALIAVAILGSLEALGANLVKLPLQSIADAILAVIA